MNELSWVLNWLKTNSHWKTQKEMTINYPTSNYGESKIIKISVLTEKTVEQKR